MSESKEVLQFPIDNSDQLVGLIEGLTEIDIDMDVESTPSTIEITLYGSENRIEEVSEKIQSLVEKSKGV